MLKHKSVYITAALLLLSALFLSTSLSYAVDENQREKRDFSEEGISVPGMLEKHKGADHPNFRINEELRFQERLKSIISYDEARKLTDNHIIDLSGPKYKQAFSESPIRSNTQAVKLDIVDIPWKYIGQRSVDNKKMHIWLFTISHENAENIGISLAALTIVINSSKSGDCRKINGRLPPCN